MPIKYPYGSGFKQILLKYMLYLIFIVTEIYALIHFHWRLKRIKETRNLISHISELLIKNTCTWRGYWSEWCFAIHILSLSHFEKSSYREKRFVLLCNMKPTSELPVWENKILFTCTVLSIYIAKSVIVFLYFILFCWICYFSTFQFFIYVTRGQSQMPMMHIFFTFVADNNHCLN